ncbi:MAG: ABC transporter substrate-binding protein [Spirochaetaceae bacterium]|jgi:NitT/TauT family transport system substrate-binding protein|nr:ABC transporter substrate-binding protein [Spirochaetaceae bacterium]
MKKSVFAVLAACLLVQGVCAGGKKEGAAQAAASDDYTLVIGLPVTGGLCEAPFYIAIEKGFYDAEGLKWKEFKMDAGTAMNHLTTGAIDVTNNLLATLIQPIANGLDVKIPLALHTGCVKTLVRADSPINGPRDLKGKKIGVASLNSSTKVIPSRVLASLGLKPDGDGADVEWVIYPQTELPLALERGLVDAIGLGDPAASIIENEGKARVIINNATDHNLKDEFCCVTPVRTAALRDHPEAIAKFLRAIQKASKWVQENPDEAARIITEKKYIAGDVAVNAQVLKTYSYKASVSQAQVAIDRNARELQQIGIVKPDVDVAALVKNTYYAVPGVPDSLF